MFQYGFKYLKFDFSVIDGLLWICLVNVTAWNTPKAIIVLNQNVAKPVRSEEVMLNIGAIPSVVYIVLEITWVRLVSAKPLA